jgi:hypothetical protein
MDILSKTNEKNKASGRVVVVVSGGSIGSSSLCLLHWLREPHLLHSSSSVSFFFRCGHTFITRADLLASRRIFLSDCVNYDKVPLNV